MFLRALLAYFVYLLICLGCVVDNTKAPTTKKKLFKECPKKCLWGGPKNLRFSMFFPLLGYPKRVKALCRRPPPAFDPWPKTADELTKVPEKQLKARQWEV